MLTAFSNLASRADVRPCCKVLSNLSVNQQPGVLVATCKVCLARHTKVHVEEFKFSYQMKDMVQAPSGLFVPKGK